MATTHTSAAATGAGADSVEGRGPTLVPVLTMWMLVMTSCGTMIGTGTYTLIGDMAGETGYATVVAFAIGTIPAVLVGLVYAALSTRFPRASSLSHWLDMSLDTPWRWLSFVGGSATACLYLCAGTSTVKGSIATVANKMLHLDVPDDGWVVRCLCVVTLGLCLALCLYGLEEASNVLAFCTAVEIGGLVLLIGLVLWSGEASNVFTIDWTALPAAKGVGAAAPSGLSWLLHVIAGGVFVVFVFGGFETVSSQAQDTLNPRRDMPRALTLSLVIVALLNVATLVACLCVRTPEQLASTSDPLTDVVGTVAPTLPRWVFDFILLFSGFNSIIGIQIHVSRTLWGMAREGKLPAAVGTVRTFHNKPQPHVALALTALLQGIMLFVFDRANLGRACAVLLSVSFVLAHTAFLFIKLQERRGTRDLDAAAWDVPVWVPVLGGAATVCILVIALHHWNSTGVLVAWTALTLTVWRLNEVGIAAFFDPSQPVDASPACASTPSTTATGTDTASAGDPASKTDAGSALPPRVEAASQDCKRNATAPRTAATARRDVGNAVAAVNVVAATAVDTSGSQGTELRRRMGGAARASSTL